MSEDILQEIADMIRQVTRLYREGKYEQAVDLAVQSCDFGCLHLGKDHPAFAACLSRLAALYHARGDYSSAEPLYQQALEIWGGTYGEQHADVVTSLYSLASLYVALQRESQALAMMNQAASIEDQLIKDLFFTTSEDQWIRRIGTFQGSLNTFLSLIFQYFSHSPTAVQMAYDLVLRRKALGASRLAVQQDARLHDQASLLEPKQRKLVALRTRITQKILSGPGQEGLKVFRQRLKKWKLKKERLEEDLARQIGEMNLPWYLQIADRRIISQMLPEVTALVEFVHFDVFDFMAVPARGELQWKPARYVAFVLLTQEPDNISMIDLGEAEPIEHMLAIFRALITHEAQPQGGYLTAYTSDIHQALEVGDETTEIQVTTSTIRTGQRHIDKRMISVAELKQVIAALEASETSEVLGSDDADTRLPTEHQIIRHLQPASTPLHQSTNIDHGLELYTAIFAPLLTALGDHRRLFIAPDGDLAWLPFALLPTSDGHYLIDEYQISFLNVGRDILQFGSESMGRPTDPLVLAAPDFDLESGKVFRHKRAESPWQASRDLDGSKLRFEHLRGTQREGEQVASLLGVNPLLADQVLEARLKRCRSPYILHIATHGFFLPDQRGAYEYGSERAYDYGGTMGRKGTDRFERLSHFENPFLRSGLALAGANTWLRGGTLPPEAEDGILTAQDVLCLELAATELVVLSACETALGEVRSNEGVLGLRQAFMLAGAKTLVMSLWKVPDRQTQELMEDFYRRLLSGQSRAEALREAQLAMKASYPQPYYWGAFICQGDPGPLSQQ